MRALRPWFLVVVAAGCGLDLPDEGILDRTRVLAARAVPVVPVAGEPFSVTSLAWAPEGTPTVVWCLPGRDCDPVGAVAMELGALTWEALDEATQDAARVQAREVGILGVEPGMPVLAGAPPTPGPIVLAAYGVPPDQDDIEVATLTLTSVGDGAAAVTAPTIDAVRLGDAAVDVVSVGVGEAVTLSVTLVAGTEGEDPPGVRWYTDAPPSGGGFGRAGGAGPAFLDDGTLDLTVVEPFEGVVIVVVRGAQGGVDWRTLPLQVR